MATAFLGREKEDGKVKNFMEGKNLHQVLVIAGGGDADSVEKMKFATEHWRNHGMEVSVYNVGWRNPATKLETKLAEIEAIVGDLAKKGPVFLVGCSAGASAAFNVFLKRHDIIEKVIGVCGRVRDGNKKWGSSINVKPYVESVMLFEGQEAEIPDELKRRMMTVTPRFGDEVVPRGTNEIEGANNIKIPTGLHGPSIGMALTFFKKPIINFIKLEPENSKA